MHFRSLFSGEIVRRLSTIIALVSACCCAAIPVPAVGNNIHWTGAANSTWVAGPAGPLNWFNTATNAPERYLDFDTTTFADTYGPSSTPVTNASVTLSTAVTPVAVTVNNSLALPYLIAGAGKITGGTTFTKQGSGTLLLQTPNDFTGSASIQGGTVNVGAQAGALGTGALTMSGDSTLIVVHPTDGAALSNSSLTMAVGSSNTVQVDGPMMTSTGLPALSGDGNLTLNTTAAGKVVTLGGNNLAYTGDVNVAANSTALIVRTSGANSSLPTSMVTLGTGGELRDTSATIQTIRLGGLIGDPEAVLGGYHGNFAASAKTWQIGELNMSSQFEGLIRDGIGIFDTTAVTNIQKVGSGTLTLTGANTYAGTTTISGGALVVNGTHSPNPFTDGGTFGYFVNSGGILGGTGMIGDGFTPVPITINSGGTLSPGEGIGMLTANGDVTFTPGSTLKIEVNAATNTVDQLAVNGDLNLGGANLFPSLFAGNLPSGPHTIATYAGTLTGTLSVPAGISINYGSGSNSQITVTINSLATVLIGDYNSDNRVDASDYNVWRESIGLVTIPNRDPANEGAVGVNDYNSWRAHFGDVGFASGAAAGTPEPGTCALAVFAILTGCCRRRDRTSQRWFVGNPH